MTKKLLKNRGVFFVLVLIFAVSGCDYFYHDHDQYEQFTVRFEANGGSPVPENQDGAFRVREPAAMNKTGYYFGGWYKEKACVNLWDFSRDTNTTLSNITLYAKWTIPEVVEGLSFYEKMRWLDSNVQNGNSYTIEVDSDVSTVPIGFSYSSKKYVTIILKGIGAKRTISSLSSNGSMFTIQTRVTLILDDNLELRGNRYSDNVSLIWVNSGGNLILNHGTIITGGTSSKGGVVISGGTFTMNGGEISGNYCRGVYIDQGGTFTMNGGEISGNHGQGVYIYNDKSNYNSTSDTWRSTETSFTMNGGKISGNTTTSGGGGVSIIGSETIFYGRLYTFGGTFTMNGGEISGNTATASTSYGGGVLVAGNNGTFTMNGGEISGNTASSYGGGVYVGSDSTFNKTGGTIFGYLDGDSNSNVVKIGTLLLLQNIGHAVHINGTGIYTMGKNTTSGIGDILSFNGSVTPPAYSGTWEY